jgi:hypothetical protein
VRLASARRLRDLTDEPDIAARRADYAFHAQTIGIATSAAVGDAMIAARRASPAEVSLQRRRWVSGVPGQPVQLPQPGQLGAALAWLRIPARAADIIATDASLRSVWFRNAARGAIALAAAVAVAKLTDLQHAFWVVLGTLSVLRTSAAATGSTAMRALAGTIAGFVVGAALLLAIGTNPVAMWVVFPLAILVAAYTPGTAPFVAGQAAFTVTVVLLFNLIAPAGWKVGLLRVEDVAIGCAVSLVVGLLFWPRGVSAVVGDNLADAFRCGASYLGDAVSWALGDRKFGPERAIAALAAGTRLDDAMRGYLTEQGSKPLAKADLWTLVMGAMRLRLTAHSMASLPGAGPHPHDREPYAWLERESADLVGFYDRLAALVAKPGGTDRCRSSARFRSPRTCPGPPQRRTATGRPRISLKRCGSAITSSTWRRIRRTSPSPLSGWAGSGEGPGGARTPVSPPRLQPPTGQPERARLSRRAAQ